MLNVRIKATYILDIIIICNIFTLCKFWLLIVKFVNARREIYEHFFLPRAKN